MTILATPGRIGLLELKNRMIFAPMGSHFDDINRQTVEYLVRRAKGGAAMLMVNLQATDYFEEAIGSFILSEKNLEYFREICRRAHEFGCKVAVQIMPGIGRIAGPAKMYPVPISASDCEWLLQPGTKCHQLSVEEIGILLDGVEDTMKLAAEAGADACEIHAYGGYLNDQFLTARWNTRSDKYGGDIIGRTTFLREQIERIHNAAGEEFPVIIKFGADHGVELSGMRTLSEGLELAKYLSTLAVDALHIDVGCYEKWQLAMPPLFYQSAVKQLYAAKAVKQVTSLPILTHGRLSNVDKAEAALDQGVCDFVLIGRGMLADPDLPDKVVSCHPEDIRPCISCNEGCIGNVLKGRHLACVLNPLTGFETERWIEKTETPKKILVVGAGPGGCTAALMAKQAGHEVELWEKGSRMGGKIIAASAPFMKNDMILLANYYSTQLFKAEIPVRFFKNADRDSIMEFAPEAIIWAAGGNVIRPSGIPGIDRPNVFSCEDALRSRIPLGERIVIVGGGLVGIEAAIHFDHNGYDVTVIEMSDRMMMNPPFIMNANMLREMMAESRAKYLTGTKLLEVTEKGIVTENSEGRYELVCDTVLLAMGWAPDAEVGRGFEDICPVFTVGDSNECRDIMGATSEAYAAVKMMEN